MSEDSQPDHDGKSGGIENTAPRKWCRRWWEYLFVPAFVLVFKDIDSDGNVPNGVWLLVVLLSIPIVALWQRRADQKERRADEKERVLAKALAEASENTEQLNKTLSEPAGIKMEAVKQPDGSTQSTLAASSKKSGEELLVGLCGSVTCLLTALVLWRVEAWLGISFYTYMLWFVIPVGALISGFAGASGYYAGSRFFGHRPTRLLLVNIVMASVATFFLIHYLSYLTLQIEGKQVSDYISFTKYLDAVIRSSSMQFGLGSEKFGSTGELGGFGYIMAVLQVVGFAVGGFCVYGYLVSKPYCEKCSRYLSAKGQQVRYTGDVEGLQSNTAQLLKHMESGAFGSAVEQHGSFGNRTRQETDHLRSVFEVRNCRKCGRHWVKFRIEKQSGRGEWKEIPNLTVAVFTDDIVRI